MVDVLKEGTWEGLTVTKPVWAYLSTPLGDAELSLEFADLTFFLLRD